MFRKMAAAHTAVEAKAQEVARSARCSLQAQKRAHADRRRVEVHALNTLLAKSDAHEVERAFGAQAWPGAAGLGV